MSRVAKGVETRINNITKDLLKYCFNEEETVDLLLALEELEKMIHYRNRIKNTKPLPAHLAQKGYKLIDRKEE